MTQDDGRPQKQPLRVINQMSGEAFGLFFAGVFENTPWIAAKAALERPFPTKEALLASMAAVLSAAPQEDRLALLRAHPVLGGAEARRGAMTADSRAEQASLGLDRMKGDEDAAFAAMNLAYRERFGFPFIIAVKGQRDRAAIRAALSRRYDSAPEAEQQVALAEVIKIAGFRLDALIDEEAAI